MRALVRGLPAEPAALRRDDGRSRGVCRVQAAGSAVAADIEISSDLMPEISAQLLCAAPGAHWLENVDWVDAFVEEPMRIEDGLAIPFDRFGTGLTWDEKRLKYLDNTLQCRPSSSSPTSLSEDCRKHRSRRQSRENFGQPSLYALDAATGAVAFRSSAAACVSGPFCAPSQSLHRVPGQAVDHCVEYCNPIHAPSGVPWPRNCSARGFAASKLWPDPLNRLSPSVPKLA